MTPNNSMTKRDKWTLAHIIAWTLVAIWGAVLSALKRKEEGPKLKAARESEAEAWNTAHKEAYKARELRVTAGKLEHKFTEGAEARRRVLADNVRLSEQEGRDQALLMTLAEAVPVGGVIFTDQAGRWEKTAQRSHDFPGWRPLDKTNAYHGLSSIHRIRRLTRHGAETTNPQTFGEAMGNMASGLANVMEAPPPKGKAG